jgi:hypothetical protein
MYCISEIYITKKFKRIMAKPNKISKKPAKLNESKNISSKLF